MRSMRFSRLLAVAFSAAALAQGAACREDRSPEPGEDDAPTTIYEIQTPRASDVAPRLGAEVYLRSVVVSAFDTSPETSARRERDARGQYYCVEETGYTGGMVVQEIDGGPMSGVSLFNPALIPAHAVFGPGDLVDVRGQYLEFCLSGPSSAADSYCDAPDTNRLTQLGSATVRRVGEAQPPVPIEISPSNLTNATHAEQFEGTLVRVSGRMDVQACLPTDSQGRTNCCVGDYDRYGNLATSAGFGLTNEFYTIPPGVTCITAVTGIVSWFGHAADWGEYSLSPRSADDVEIPPECRP